VLHEFRRRHAALGEKLAREIARTHTEASGETSDGMVFPGVGQYPGLQLADVGTSGGLGLKKNAELILSAGPTHKNDHQSGDETRRFPTEILLDECERDGSKVVIAAICPRLL